MHPYHLVQPKDLFALGRQVNLCHGNLPALITPSEFGTSSATDDLVAEADTHDAHTVRLDGLFRILDELEDPRIIVKRRMPGTGDEDGVNVLERRIRVKFVDNIVSLDRHNLVQLLRRLERIGSRV